MKRTVKFNINEPITATLTAEGAAAYNADHESFWKAYPHWATPQKAGDVVKVQLWQAMRTWGHMLFAGGPVAFVDCEILMDVDAPDADAELANLKAENAALSAQLTATPLPESRVLVMQTSAAVTDATKDTLGRLVQGTDRIIILLQPGDKITDGSGLFPAVQLELIERASRAEAEIARLREAQRWVSVSDAMPIADWWVLTTDGKRHAIQLFDARELIWMDGDHNTHAVTHWMLLPAPPEAQP